MFRTCLSYVVLVAFAMHASGCAVGGIREVTPQAAGRSPEGRIVSVTMRGGAAFTFDGGHRVVLDHRGYRVVPPSVRGDSIHGRVQGSLRTVALADVTSLSLDGRRVDAGNTAGLVLAVLGVAATIVFVVGLSQNLGAWHAR